MNPTDLRARTKKFSLRVMSLVDALPNTHSGRVIADQLIRSGLSVGANYRAAMNGRSTTDGVLLHGDGVVKRSGTARDAVEGESFRVPGNGRKGEQFIAKLGTVREEADESAFWLEIIMDGQLLESSKVVPLHKEAIELFAIFTTSIKTAKSEDRRKKPPKQT